MRFNFTKPFTMSNINTYRNIILFQDDREYKVSKEEFVEDRAPDYILKELFSDNPETVYIKKSEYPKLYDILGQKIRVLKYRSKEYNVRMELKNIQQTPFIDENVIYTLQYNREDHVILIDQIHKGGTIKYYTRIGNIYKNNYILYRIYDDPEYLIKNTNVGQLVNKKVDPKIFEIITDFTSLIDADPKANIMKEYKL